MATDEIEVAFGGGKHERVCLTVLGRSHPGSSDFWDGNWLRTSVDVAVGGFTGRFAADLRAEEFRSFNEELSKLYRTLEGHARFETLEGQVSMTLMGNGMGHVALQAELRDRAGTGNRLRLEFATDQTYLPGIIESLDAVDAAWPVQGQL